MRYGTGGYTTLSPSAAGLMYGVLCWTFDYIKTSSCKLETKRVFFFSPELNLN